MLRSLKLHVNVFQNEYKFNVNYIKNILKKISFKNTFEIYMHTLVLVKQPRNKFLRNKIALPLHTKKKKWQIRSWFIRINIGAS